MELSFESLSDGFGMQDRVGELFHERLLPRMEALFDEMGGSHDIVFDSLEIDCGILQTRDWEETLIDKAIFELRQKLLAANKIFLTPEGEVEKLKRAFLYFIQHGAFAWSERIESVRAFEFLRWDEELGAELFALLTDRPKRIRRLAEVVDEKFLIDLSKQYDSSSPDQPVKAVALSAVEKIRQAVEARLSEKEPGKVERKDSKRNTRQVVEEDGLMVQNAGLVLLHPFLVQLFENIGIYGEEGWLHEHSAEQAMSVLYWLARGDEVMEEPDLAFIKLLCGVSVEEPVVLLPLADEIMKNECLELLGAVIENWQVLKNTSPDGLREAFLHRQGIVNAVDRGWTLRLENKPIDVLLQKLPWGLGVIRLPWMNETIFVEWY